jgi:DNA-binding PadR family transcriptional regulator
LNLELESLSLDLAILGFLGERAQSGYDLKTKSFEGPLRAFWSADQAQIYRTLERLRRDGLVTFRRRRQSSRPDRRVFELTVNGREALDEKAGDTTAHAPLRDGFLVQLYFSAGLSDDALLALMVERRAGCQSQLDAIRARAAELATDASVAPRAAVLKQTALDGAAAQLRSTIDWLDDCIQAVEEGALPGSESGTGQRHLFGG